ncbi:Putative transcription factor CBF/NF-Y/archaeal histone domain, histone-fold [Septoria linicola]|uniref:DNA polymerase epsilon subunit D n=1 Tax=Septoria linicola TaxID=215465 RepID=A0A9Q9AJZ2_9PEZI|nr:putative transcription factor CBF/NF-Y/archaeal histone domain, histone-fold [Septoria linicola]USW47472.1 Putative transcription factor CBF/NF-Y/archaeal histone domain, histone-fold [Septoria linicola]
MPGRKSNVSTTSVGPEEVPEGTPSAQSKASKEKEGLSVEDLSLPKSMVARLAKGVLPANTQIHKDALLALHKSATVFVNFIASNSNDNAQAAGKKTIAPQDVMAALKDSEYETFLPRLEAELKKYNETQCDKRNTYRRKVKADKDAAVEKEGGEGDTTEIGDTSGAPPASSPHTNGASASNVEDDAARPAKKLKGEHGTAIKPGADDDMADDDGDDDEQDGNDQDEDDDDEAVDDEVPDEDESEDDQPMEDALEEQEAEASGNRDRDEALDDPDSD